MKGLLTETFTRALITAANDRDIPVVVDVKDTHAIKYSGAFLLKPNLSELKRLTGLSVKNDDEIVRASEHLRKICKCSYVLTTCGARGMALVGGTDNQRSDVFWINSTEHKVYDVTGAGDTAIAYLGACLANRFPIRDAVRYANFAAGIQVSKVGTSMVYLREVEELDSGHSMSMSHKLLSSSDVSVFRSKNAGKKIVFTNGCFDILHVGHIRYLREAAKLGNLLVVGLNSDTSVKRLKGTDRPINHELDRAEMLCAFSFVDYVVIFDEDTPYRLIQALQPDVLVKGGDYTEETVVGADLVRAGGGTVSIIPFVDGKSTTSILGKIKQMDKNA